MFRRSGDTQPIFGPSSPERVNSILGPGISWNGHWGAVAVCVSKVPLRARSPYKEFLVVAETGRVTCREIRANQVIVAGAVRADIITEKLEIRSTGRVWGNVVTAAFSTEEGAFLRGQVRMEAMPSHLKQ
jgi:hypothetical protein